MSEAMLKCFMHNRTQVLLNKLINCTSKINRYIFPFYDYKLCIQCKYTLIYLHFLYLDNNSELQNLLEF